MTRPLHMVKKSIFKTWCHGSDSKCTPKVLVLVPYTITLCTDGGTQEVRAYWEELLCVPCRGLESPRPSLSFGFLSSRWSDSGVRTIPGQSNSTRWTQANPSEIKVSLSSLVDLPGNLLQLRKVRPLVTFTDRISISSHNRVPEGLERNGNTF